MLFTGSRSELVGYSGTKSQILTLFDDALFTDKEMGSKCYSRGKRGTKEELPQEKLELMKGWYSNSIINRTKPVSD